ncbi:MAG: methyltransferase domain-containing protein [Acetobacteraceae bacterium]|nr:methyltransferase domain-containing protein [Acetobacteraceae bacterium]
MDSTIEALPVRHLRMDRIRSCEGFEDGASRAVISALCPVCGYTLAASFFDGGRQPLATLGWPGSAEKARTMPLHALDWVQCPQCSHVWNRSFCYEAIPYASSPNRMFNSSGIWAGHLAGTRDLVLSYLPECPTVLDIGCGEGHFVRGIAEALSGHGRFVGFDPNATGESGKGVEFHARLFEPLLDMAKFAPDVVIIRHVLEHLTNPAAFVEQLGWAAAQRDRPVWLFAEVPCIDRIAETGRLADFFFEHPSHFSTASFTALMQRAGKVETLKYGYAGEVVFALVQLGARPAARQRVAAAARFRLAASASRTRIGAQLDALAASGRRVAIWGGTGKAAAFINLFNADARRFPLVVDSDLGKTGTFVPGTGQEIVFRDVLKTHPADVVIIPSQWRARDIIAEMARESIDAGQVLIEHEGSLVDFALARHPY